MKTRNFKYFFEQSNSQQTGCIEKLPLRNSKKNQCKSVSDLCWFFFNNPMNPLKRTLKKLDGMHSSDYLNNNNTNELKSPPFGGLWST